MMTPAVSIHIVLLIIAVICFVIAAIPFPSRVNLLAVGLVFFSLAHLL